MSGPDRETESLEIGGRRIEDHIARAMDENRATLDSDGRYRLNDPDARQDSMTSDTPTIAKSGSFAAPCRFLNHFLFALAYGEAQVPYGCRACYKIWIRPATLRALFSVKEMLDAMPYTSKIKVEALDPLSPNVYLALVYGGDLPATRDAFRLVRAAVDADARLGEDVAMEIRRGCQNYERRCGPSDQYAFDPRLEAIEARLAARFADAPPPARPRKHRDAAAKLRMVQIAHQLGDESYRDFTGGKSLSIAPRCYAPDTDARDGTGNRC